MKVNKSQWRGPDEVAAERKRVVGYLREKASNRRYFVSKLIGYDLGISPKCVGYHMKAISDANGEYGVKVSKWAYTRSTTWMVEVEA